MPSQTEICNRALAAIGAGSIASMTEDSPEARQANRWFTPTLEQCLRAAHWTFARKYVSLAVLKALPGTPENPDAVMPDTWNDSLPPPPWTYTYQYPNDCIHLRYIMVQQDAASIGTPIFTGMSSPSIYSGTPVKWVKAKDGNVIVICCNERRAIACYTENVTNPDLWDAHFTQAVVDALAGHMAQAITGDKALRKLKLDDANQMILTARQSDGNEGVTIYDHLPDWIAARGVASVYGQEQATVESYGPLFQ